MNVTFEYTDEDFFEQFGDYLSEQVEKYQEVIRDSVAFLGWKVANRPHQLAVMVRISLDEIKDKQGRLRNFDLEMVVEGRKSTKVACRLIDKDNDSELGLFVFKEFPSWDYEEMTTDLKDSIDESRGKRK